MLRIEDEPTAVRAGDLIRAADDRHLADETLR
jgi:hypothetical protein